METTIMKYLLTVCNQIYHTTFQEAEVLCDCHVTKKDVDTSPRTNGLDSYNVVYIKVLCIWRIKF